MLQGAITTGILLGSSGSGPNFSLNGATPFPRVLQGTWEEEVGSEGVMGQVPVPQGWQQEQQQHLGPSHSSGDDTISITRLPHTPCLM